MNMTSVTGNFVAKLKNGNEVPVTIVAEVVMKGEKYCVCDENWQTQSDAYAIEYPDIEVANYQEIYECLVGNVGMCIVT